MKAELILENIGSHRSLRSYSINSGKITVFEGSNSSGKTTIIKSLATILSSPINSKNLINEAIKFGILPMEKKESPIVNIFENQAKITLIYGDVNLKATLYKDGKIESNSPGKENFLYSSMLVKNSKIQEYLNSGNDNFQWIVSEMSNAGKFEELKEINDSYVRLINAAKNTLKDINKKIGNYLKEINILNDKKKKLETDLLKVREDKKKLDTSDYPEIEKLEKVQKKFQNDISITKQQIESHQDEQKKQESDLKQTGSKISDIEIEINKEKNKISENNKEIKRLESYKLNDLNEIIIFNQDQLPDLIDQQSHYRTLKDLHNTILNKRLETDTCPICESKVMITKKKISKKIKDLNKKLDEISIEKNKIQEIIKNTQNIKKDIENIGELKKRVKNSDEIIQSKITKINTLISDKDRLLQEINRVKTSISFPEDQLIELENELTKTNEQLKKHDILKPFIEKENEILSQIQKIEIDMGKYNELIKENSEIELFSLKIPIDKAEKIVNNLSEEFEKIELYLIEKINEQRLGAGKKFNSTIKDIITELKLDDFEDISLNLEDYHLTVVRKGGKIQPLGALGGAEKGIIGGILQISCKQTYLEEIPFFVGDDIILEFDPEKSKTFIDYLKKLAMKEGIFIIITKISDNKELKQIEI